MSTQDEQDSLAEQPLSTTDSEDTVNNVKDTFKSLLIAIAGVALLLSIFILLPMAFTYLSNGDYRP